MVKTILKDVIFFSILTALVILAANIVFYDKVPNTKVISEEKKYVRPDDITEILGEQVQESGINTTPLTYEINELDLNSLKKQNVYQSGKANPFAQYNVINSEETSNTENGSSTNSQNNTNGTANVTEYNTKTNSINTTNPQDDFSRGQVDTK